MKLYEFNKAIEDAFERAIDVETGEILDDGAIKEMEALEIARDEKIEGVILWSKNLRSDAEAIKNEEDAMKDRRKAIERKADSVERWIERILNGEKFETARCKVSWRKSTSVEADESIIPEDYVNTSIVRTPDKAKIKADLKAGVVIEGAQLVEKLNMSIK